MQKLIVASLVVLCGHALADDQPHPTSLSAAGGRFVFGQISGFRADQYMLDTQTGQLWVSQCADEKYNGVSCSKTVLVPVLYQWGSGQTVSYSFLPQIFHPDPPPKK